jgi:ferredoxin-NADP reductase
MGRIATLRRDLTTLANGLIGRTPPPLIARRTRTAPRSPLGLRTAVIEAITRETADATSITLRDPTGASLAFTPGQFFTIETTIDGERVRRAYSASSDARDSSKVTITVKRVAGGRMSTFLTERAAVGMTVSLLGPSGDFTLTAAPPSPHLVAIAGGSGITPIMAIARAVVANPAGPRLTLLYANRDRDAIIFRAALDELTARHADRLTVDHLLDTTGPLDAATLAARLDRHAPPADAVYLVCGPEPMMALARDTLTGRGVDATRIREERFFAPTRPTVPTAAQPLTIRRGGTTTRAIVRAGDTILDAGLAAGAPLKLSCAMGGCGACAVTLTEGAVAMDEPNCLTDAERARGTILACIARPTAPCTIEAPT